MNKICLTAALLCAVLIPVNTVKSISSEPYSEIARGGAVYSSHENDSMKISLTFDDGPHPEYTPAILDILDKYGIKATFFMVGENARMYPELVSEVILRGHEIGNHTATHTYLKGKNDETILEEISGCERSVYEACDYCTKLLRPPGGLYDGKLKKIANEIDYTIVLWSVDTRDWAHTPVEKIEKNVLENVKNGDIILCHDYICGDSPTPQALETIIPKLVEKGYSFVTVSELIFCSSMS